MNHFVPADTQNLPSAGSIVRVPSLPAMPAMAAPVQVAAADGEEDGFNYKRLWRLYRRRVVVTAVLSLMLAGGGGYAGYTAGKQTFRSTSQVRVLQNMPVVLRQSDVSGPMSQYDAFVNTNMQLVSNRRTVEMAVNDPVWTASGGSAEPAATADFIQSLSVGRNGEMVFINFDADTPALAEAGARAITAAYRRIEGETQSSLDEDRNVRLQSHITQLESDLRVKTDQIRVLSEQFGTGDVSRLYDAVFASVQETRHELDNARETLVGVEELRKTVDAGGEWSDDRLATVSPIFSQTLQRVRDGEDQLERLVEVQGHGPNSRLRGRAQRDLDLLQRRLDELRQSELQRVLAAGETADPSTDNVVTPEGSVLSVGILQRRVAALSRRLQSEEEELVRLGRANVQLTDYRRREDELRAGLREASQRMETLRIEGQMAGRVQILNEASRPLSPHKDTRPTFAVAGGLFGGMLGLGVMGLMGLSDRRLRDVDDVNFMLGGRIDSIGGADAQAVLGVLPELPVKDLSDPAAADAAAHAVNELRTLLELHAARVRQRSGRRGVAIVVSSPDSGSGKTTLSTTLGVSFAAAGSRVLLVDADFVGGGLTRCCNAMIRRRVGSILRRQGLLSVEQLDEALGQSVASGRKLGQLLVERGVVTEQQLAAALEGQQADQAGVLDALAGEPLDELVAATGVDNLSVLPRGGAHAGDAYTSNPQQIRRLLEECCLHFDVVLVDTGPVPGSLEAAAAAGAADGVLIVASRDEQAPAVVRSIDYVRGVGGSTLGLVFNRANPRDLRRSTMTSGSRARSIVRSSPAQSGRDLEALVRTVTHSRPETDAPPDAGRKAS